MSATIHLPGLPTTAEELNEIAMQITVGTGQMVHPVWVMNRLFGSPEKFVAFMTVCSVDPERN